MKSANKSRQIAQLPEILSLQDHGDPAVALVSDLLAAVATIDAELRCALEHTLGTYSAGGRQLKRYDRLYEYEEGTD